MDQGGCGEHIEEVEGGEEGSRGMYEARYLSRESGGGGETEVFG